VAKVMRMLNDRGLDLPRRDRHGDVRWYQATSEIHPVATLRTQPPPLL
jgi:hypothetical protein